MLATLVVLLLALPAAAHPDDEERPAGDLVRQAIALLATTPDDREELREKLDAARQAADTTGVDLPLVEQAAALFDEADPPQARVLLERTVGAQTHLGPRRPCPEPPDPGLRPRAPLRRPHVEQVRISERHERSWRNGPSWPVNPQRDR